MFSKTNKKLIFTLFSIFSFLIALTFLLACIEPIALLIIEFLKYFKPNLTAEKLSKLRGVLLGNVFLFCVFGIFFILVQFVQFRNETVLPLQIFKPLKEIKQIGTQRTIIILSTFILISACRFYWMNQKISFHEDEMYSISIITQNEYGLWSGKDFDKGKEYTGKEIKDLIFFDDASIKDTILDIAHLWIYNKDTAYNNLYLYLSRLWFTGFKTANFKATFIRASLLNYVFFCFSFYFLFILLGLLRLKFSTKIIIVLAAFLNPASIGISVFMRSYALQETILILFSYIFAYYYQNLQYDMETVSIRNFFITSTICTLLLSTDYFSILFLGITGIVLLWNTYKKDNLNTALFLLCSVFAGFLFSKCLYLNYGTGFFSGRGAEAFSIMKNSVFSNFIKTSITLNKLISENIFNFIILVIISIITAIFKYKNEKKISESLVILICSFLFCFIVLFLSPITTLRYIAPVFPLIALFLAIESNKMKKQFYIHIFQAIILLVIVSKVLPIKSNFSKIEHLNDTNQAILESQFIKTPEIPVIISRSALYPDILPYINDNQKVYFADTLEEVQNFYFQNESFWWLSHIKNADGTRTFNETLMKLEK